MPTKERDVTSVLVFEITNSYENEILKNIFNEIIESYRATYPDDSQINTLLDEAYIACSDEQSLLVIAEKSIKEKIIEICTNY